MRRIDLYGVDGTNPLGFMASLGLLRVIPGARLGFRDDGSFQAFVEGLGITESKLASMVVEDARRNASESAGWRLSYTKGGRERPGGQEVADLKAPPTEFKRFLAASINAWLSGNDEAVNYAAAYGTDVAVDGKGNTKPTAFHFTAGQQTFLSIVEEIRKSLTQKRDDTSPQEWVETSLFKGHGEKPGSNLRWDPGAERNWALMASDPSREETSVDAPLEWLAFRGLPLLPTFPRGNKIVTTGVVGQGDDMTFTWPLWSLPISLETARSVVQVDWSKSTHERRGRGIFAICSCAIRRTAQGYGNFAPSTVIRWEVSDDQRSRSLVR